MIEGRRALVAIDLGAESCRVSLLRFSGALPEVQVVHRFPNHAAERADGLHWDLECILDGLRAGLEQCAAIATEGIGSVGVDGWAVDYVRLNADGSVVGEPFCYRDERTLAAETALHERLSAERMRELTAIQLLRLNSVYQMFADSEEGKKLRWMNLPEYVLFSLGGRAVAERTNATHTQMVDAGGEWSGEIFGAIGQDIAAAPAIVEPGTDVGELTAMPGFAGTRLIAPACHDTASAIAAIPDAGDDWAYISSGTWSLVGTVLDAPNNSELARAANFTNLGGADGTVCFHKNVNGMWLLRQCLESWGGRVSLLEALELAGGCSAPGYLLDVDDPELLLQGNMPGRINAQLRRRGLAEMDEEDAGAISLLIFHSLAARYAEVLGHVREITGKQLKRLYIMGGGSQNRLLNRLTAEATGLEVVLAGTECSTVGNFAIQLAAVEGKEFSASERRELRCAWAAKLGAATRV